MSAQQPPGGAPHQPAYGQQPHVPPTAARPQPGGQPSPYPPQQYPQQPFIPAQAAPPQAYRAAPPPGAPGYRAPYAPVPATPPHTARPPATPAPRRKSSAPAVVVAVVVTAALSVAGTLFATGAFTKTPVFDPDEVALGVADVLVSNFQLADVDRDEVWCPADILVEEGNEFECTFSSGGKDLSVPVLVLNDKGQFRVGGPDEG